MRSAWRPSQGTQHTWITLGLNVDTDDDGVTTIVIPAGTRTDLGTVPRMLWWFCSPVDIAMAAVIHDEMYGLIHRSITTLSMRARMQRRAEADDVFLLALKAQEAAWTPRVWAVWLAVRVFGWLFAYDLISP